jgi:hypothetical protein
VTPLDITSGPAEDVCVGPVRGELGTDAEREIKQVQYAQRMALQWMQLLQRRHQATAGENESGKLNPDQTSLVLSSLVPILVEALAELLRVCEGEDRAARNHAKALRRDPALKPRVPLAPVEWLASYLVRHNPRHVANTNPLTLIYQKSVQEALQQAQLRQDEAEDK